jgi:hypothetical protein
VQCGVRGDALLAGQQSRQDGHGVRGGADTNPPVLSGITRPPYRAGRVGLNR